VGKIFIPIFGSEDFSPFDEQSTKRVEKGWGWEDWIWNGPDYCGKILHFFDGKQCSWHYHEIKEETFLIKEGRIFLLYGWDHDISKAASKVLDTGDSFHVPPGLVHRMKGYKGDAEIIEFSTHHEDSDSYRVLKGD
jgi:mannose-6-phosphate isomerase-like protein (cupin superfamily)